MLREKNTAWSSFCQFKEKMHYSRDKTSQLAEVYSYLVSTTDTRWSCGEFERLLNETVICNFPLKATEKEDVREFSPEAP